MSNYIKYKLDYLLIVLLSFPILFLKLGSFSLRLWDESIYATNSIEMMERGSWIVPYYNGEMDYWNTKPPLINWLQIISMKIFGINEFAIRFPSALAALGTIFLVYWFLKKYFNSITGIIASLVLLTTVGFISFHGARTGDTDVLLTLFITTTNLFVLDLILKQENVGRKAILIFVAITLAFLSKSIAAFLFLPAILIYAFIYEMKFVRQLISNKTFWLALIGSLVIIIGFIFARNSLQPGYINLLFTSDLGRVGTAIEQHQEPFNFYIDNLVLHRFSYWIIFLMASLVLLFTNDSNETRVKILRFTSILSIFYFLLISFSVTKLAWYDIPLFPLLAINIAIVIEVLLEKLQFNFKKSIIAVLFIFFIPYKHVFGLSQTNHYVEFEMENEVKERYLKILSDSDVRSNPKSNKEKITIYHDGYTRAIEFYKKALGQKYIADVRITNQPDFKMGEIVWISDTHLKNIFEEKYNFKIIKTFENLTIYQVNKTNQTN